ncbi:MAG: GyrI-like domain-containing protein [Eubacteriales bacterium]|nr:GyrI-like domain-containing protein [Eubacteriales bacterium]
MKYEIVTLEEKIVAGLAARTNNLSPDSPMVIGGLWQRFYGEGVYQSLTEKINDKTLGIYTDYAGNEKDDYTVMVACELKKLENIPENVSVKHIDSGKYAKFVIKGKMDEIVPAFWQELWQMDLPRAFGSDFEEYQNSDMENAEVHVYISLI